MFSDPSADWYRCVPHKAADIDSAKTCRGIIFQFQLVFTKICESAFDSCERLDNIILPNELAFIKESSFAHCTSLNTITIPKSLEKFDGSEIFAFCLALQEVIFAFL